MARWKLDVQAQRMNEWKKGKKVWKPPMALTELYLILFDFIWFYLIWFDLIWFDEYLCPTCDIIVGRSWITNLYVCFVLLCVDTSWCSGMMSVRYSILGALVYVCVCVCVCVRHSWLRCASLSGILSLSLVQYKLIKGAVSSVDADFHFMGLRDGCWQRKSDWIDFVLIVIRSFGFHNHTWRRCVSD